VSAIRGATTVEADDPDAIDAATRELLREIVARNAIAPTRVISAIFTATTDLTSTYPARAARSMGWEDVPLLCAAEIAVPGGLPCCVRVLLHVEELPAHARPRHVYLRGARVLRPDLMDRDDR
jgi:chorismate mutase